MGKSAMYVQEAVFNRMEEIGLDPESELFLHIMEAVVAYVEAGEYYRPDHILAQAARQAHDRIAVKYKKGECREHTPSACELFRDWTLEVRGNTEEDWDLTALLEDLEQVAWLEHDYRKLPKEGINANGVSAGKGAGAGAAAADTAEPVGNADGIGDRDADWGCGGAEAGDAEEECLDYGEEDEETTTDRILRALALGSESELRYDVGVSGEESGEASDETGRVEGRKTRFGSLPPMSEYRTSLYAQGVCR